MSLASDQSGELYRQVALDAQVGIEIPALFLSVMKSCLFDTAGKLSDDIQQELTTKLIMDTHMILIDAFARQTFYT